MRLQAFEMNRRMFAELRDRRPGKPSTTRSGALLTAASIALLLFDLALLGGGGWLVLAGPGLSWLLGLLLILVGLECRLRFERIDTDQGKITREAAPRLFAVIEQAGVVVGAPRIDTLVVTDDFNAFCGRSGLRQRTVLGIGLPLWAALSTQGRTALLGHELGHLVNGDPTTSFTTQPALTTFARLARVFQPRGLVGRTGTGLEGLVAPLAYLIFGPLYLACRSLHARLLRIAAPDHQRAEAFADALASELAGSSGAAELMTVLLVEESVGTALRRVAASGSTEASEWREAVAKSLAARTKDLRRTEQLSLRHDVSPYATHPPAGLRARLIASWPDTPGRLSISESDYAAADRELAPMYQRVRRAMANAPLVAR